VLKKIFRQAGESLIVTNAHAINSGEDPELFSKNNDFFFIAREDEKAIADTVASLIVNRIPKKYGADPFCDIQVITPSHRGNAGTESLNITLQRHLNPPSQKKREKKYREIVFREGDKVMQVANNYDIEWRKCGLDGIGIFNGDIGVIESINFNEENMLIRFDDRLVDYPFDNLDELELAYAITVHKSQGSEYNVVIIPMYSCPPMLMTRNLLYTAVTRARRMVILVGRSDIPERMVNNNREVMRYTTLVPRLKDIFERD
jgi:exodeoxyribonuclease V alpha subunit